MAGRMQSHLHELTAATGEQLEGLGLYRVTVTGFAEQPPVSPKTCERERFNEEPTGMKVSGGIVASDCRTTVR